MTEHMPIFKSTNGGPIRVECSCGWEGGSHSSRQSAKLAHWAHVDGTPAVPPLNPVVTASEVSYVTSEAPYPGSLPICGHTAENLLRFSDAQGFLASIARNMLDVKLIGKDEWLVHFYAMTGAFNLHLALTALRRLDQREADDVAERIIDGYESGGEYGEFLWHWLSEHGIDPDRIKAEADDSGIEVKIP